MDIIFVTNQKSKGWEERYFQLQSSITDRDTIIFTGLDDSASANRNYGLERVESDIFIMVDDDIEGFYGGWIDRLVSPMWEDESNVCVSARLLNPDASPGSMMGNNNIYASGAYPANKSGYNGYTRLPTACLTLRKNDLRYDEGFIGSGYEDTDYMNHLNLMYPVGRFLINNNCRLVHLNEQKNQGGVFFQQNKKYYLSKYPDDSSVVNQTDWTV